MIDPDQYLERWKVVDEQVLVAYPHAVQTRKMVAFNRGSRTTKPIII